MPVHDYSPQEAFALLIRKLTEQDKDLAARVQAVVDEGKDVEETEFIGSRRKKTRLYRKTMPYSYEEALQAALKALESYFIGQPLFASSCLQKGLGRAFVGLVDDLGTNLRVSGLCSNSFQAQLRDYFRPQRRPCPNFRLTPLEPSNEDIFVNQIKAELKKLTAS
jgi:hypothetical protein